MIKSCVIAGFVSCIGEFVAEFRARGSSHAGIFISSASKSKVELPGAGFSLAKVGRSTLLKVSRLSGACAGFPASTDFVDAPVVPCVPPCFVGSGVKSFDDN